MHVQTGDTARQKIHIQLVWISSFELIQSTEETGDLSHIWTWEKLISLYALQNLLVTTLSLGCSKGCSLHSMFCLLYCCLSQSSSRLMFYTTTRSHCCCANFSHWTHTQCRSIKVKWDCLPYGDQMTSLLWDLGSTQPEELIRSLLSGLIGLREQALKPVIPTGNA